MQTLLVLFFVTLSLITGCTRSQESAGSKNTIFLPVIERIKGLDPAQSSDLYSNLQVAQIYDGLYQYHYLKRPYVLETNLAEAMPEYSEGGRVVTIKIKKGVLFQDDPCFKESGGKGRELVAEDFVYSWKRLADPKVQSTGWWIFDGKIVGLNEWRETAQKADKADYTTQVEGLQATDRYTIKVKLIEPSYMFLYYLAMPFAFVVPKEAVAHYDKDFMRSPVGTGPFIYDRSESNLNAKLVFKRNPTYRPVFYPSEGEPGDKEKGLLEDTGKQLPFADELIYTVFVEDQPQWLNFMAGKLDASGIPKDNYQQAISPGKELTEEMKTKNLVLIKSPELDITHETFNMADPIIGQNKLLRQAISLAYNIDSAIELFYNGRAVPAQGPVPPGLEGYDPLYKNPYRQFNLEKAKELLAQAGFPEGKGLAPIEHLSPASSTSRQFAEYFSKSLAAIGLQVKISQFTWPEFQAALKNKKGQMWGYAWSADYPDAENFLQLFYSKNASPGPNDSNYSNPEFDGLYEQSLKLQNSPERTELYKKMVAIVTEDCPWIFGVHRLAFQLTHPWLKNLKIHDFEHSRAKYYRLDLSLRK